LTTSRKGRIFISYRRNDTSYAAGRIYDRLAAHFGEDAIFMDVEAIEGGLDFVNVLEEAVQACDVLIALIGRQWINSKDDGGNRRLDNPEDFVRVEIATALHRDIRVIPVLVDGFHMPHSTELPENLKLFARRNALQVNHPSFNADVNRLITHIELALKAAEESRILKVQAEKTEREVAEQTAREKAAKEAAEKAAREKAEKEAAEEVAREKAKQEAAEKAAQEKKEKEAAEIAAREKAEREAAEQAVREKAAKEAAEKAARERAEREAAEKAAKEKAEREAAERKAARQASWLAFIQKITSILNTSKQRITSLKIGRKPLIITALVTLVIAVALVVFIRVNNPPLFFSGVSGGAVNIYSYKGKSTTKITQTAVGAKNWSPTRGIGGTLYFTSNRSGKAEIHGFNTLNGDLWQITTTPGGAESWSPATGVGENIYFTSNRSGKAEIYGFNTLNGELWQITATPGEAESWSPALGVGGIVYFTSDRSGKAEIYGFNTLDGELWQITSTPGGGESWSPAIGLGNNLFFTSNRTGKAEVYKFDTNSGELEQMTNTPGNAESWAPVLLGNKIYITSNRSGRSKVYLLGHEDAPIVEIESWTKKISDRIPGY